MPELKDIEGENFNSEVTLDVELLAHTQRQDDPHKVSNLQGVANGFASLDSSGKIPLIQIPSSLLSGLTFIGTWDASSGSDPSASPSDGEYWIVDVDGTTTLSGISSWVVGDMVLYSGGVWNKIAGGSSLHNILTDLQGGDVSLSEFYHLNYLDYRTLVGGTYNADHLHQHSISGQVFHDELLNLQGGTDEETLPEYYHMSKDEHDILTLGGNANSLHTHDACTYTLYVSKYGNDTLNDGSFISPYLTIKAAVASISDNSASNRYMIKVSSGVYSEDNPIEMKSYVDIQGSGEIQQTQIIAQNVDSNIINGESSSGLSNMVLKGTNQCGIEYLEAGMFIVRDIILSNCACGISINNSSALVDINRVLAYNDTSSMTIFIRVLAGQVVVLAPLIVAQSEVETGILADGSDALMFVSNYVTNSNNITTAVDVKGSADVTINGARITGDLGDRIGTAFKCTEDGSELDILSAYVQHADYGIYIDNNSQIDAASTVIENCDVGLYAGSNDLPISRLFGGSIADSLTWDVYLSTDDCSLRGSGVAIDENKLYLNGAHVTMSHISSNEGDEGLNIKGELHVGSPERGYESVFGEGDSYTRGLLAYSFDGSNYTDISSDVQSYSGSTFTFPNLNVNTSIYLSSNILVNELSDYHQFLGIKMLSTIAQIGGTVVVEYWNGSAWSTVNHMITQSADKYLRKGNQLFSVTPGTYQIRFNPFIVADWTKNEPSVGMGSRYWIRFRISSGLTTAPVFEQFKLHTNRTELNEDGYVEYFGSARTYSGVPVPWSTFQDAGSSLGDQDLWLSTNCKVGLINNNFNTNGDSIGAITFLKPQIDTSAPLKLRAAIVSASSGSLTMTSYLNSSIEGAAISTTDPTTTVGESSISVTQTVVAGELTWFNFNFNISDKGIQTYGSNPELLWINLEATTRPGNVYGLEFGISSLAWRNGGHV